MDGGKLWQEGGGNGHGDVTSGRHTTFVVHISADTQEIVKPLQKTQRLLWTTRDKVFKT